MTGFAATILLVESEPDLGRTIAEQLSADGYRVSLALSAEHARKLAREQCPALALIGGMDSARGQLLLLEEIRGAPRETPWDRALPAIVIGRSARQLDVLRAFEAGADDFLASRAPYLELRARMRAVLRRIEACQRSSTLEIGALHIDRRSHVVHFDGEVVDLRRMEYELLLHLAREPERVFSKAELLHAVWGYRAAGSSRTVDSHACRLRRKLSRDPHERWVINVWGVGYRLHE